MGRMKKRRKALFCWLLNILMQLLKSESGTGAATFDPGAICNLACVTCNHKASTRWQHEMGMPVIAGNPKEIDPDMIIEAKQLPSIVIGGGEPVLNFSTKTLLTVLNQDQNVSIHFNGTVLPDKEFLEASKRFRTIYYVFSLDGVAERFEYLRWPGKWNRVVNNIIELVQIAPDNVEFGVNITISQLNKNYYHEVLNWINQSIPQNKQGRQTYVSYNQDLGNLTQKYLDNLDKKRNLDWRKLFPLAIPHIN
jgi:MoaA/NifB/PqqE/SkfB family radical SAM enzyme